MSRIHGKSGRVILNTLSVTSQTNGWAFVHSRHYTMAAVLGDTGERWDPGLLSGSVMLKGFNDTSNGLRTLALAAAGTDDGLVTTILPEANTVGAIALMTMADQGSFEASVEVTDSAPFTINGQAQDGVDMGFLLHPEQAETADGNGTSIDNLGASSGGAVGVLHVTSYTTFTSVVVKVQHSTDNSAWADLITFTTATAATQERIKVTGTVNRYLRAFWDVTGSGTATFVVSAARR